MNQLSVVKKTLVRVLTRLTGTWIGSISADAKAEGPQ